MTATFSASVPFREYLALPGAHFTALTAMALSALHYRRRCDESVRDTPALRLGRLTHALTLTPDLPLDVAVFDGPTRRGKAWDAFRAEAAEQGREIATDAEIATGRAMAHAVHAYAPAAQLLAPDGQGEVTVTWAEEVALDPATYTSIPWIVDCRARLDYYSASRGLVELKTTRTIGRTAWAREVASRSYHVQLAHYVNGIAEVTGARPREVHWIVVENQPPYDVAVYRVSSGDIERGAATLAGWLRKVAECEASGVWPGVGGAEALDFVLPDYAVAEGLEEVDTSGLDSPAEANHG